MPPLVGEVHILVSLRIGRSSAKSLAAVAAPRFIFIATVTGGMPTAAIGAVKRGDTARRDGRESHIDVPRKVGRIIVTPNMSVGGANESRR